MEQSQNMTPRGTRIHIGFFGRRNAGKSSLVNAIAGQAVSIVSDIRGTTTDPVEKAMELLPIGAVVLIDTPGLDDAGSLGALRVARTQQAIRHTDLAVLVIDGTLGIGMEETRLQKQLDQQHIPYLLVWNKADLVPLPDELSQETHIIAASVVTGQGISTVKEHLGTLYQQQSARRPERTIFGGILSPEDVVLLVTPIDESAPKGRMILPQVQAIREILDQTAICLVTQPEQLPSALKLLREPPKLVVTDSQAFGQIQNLVPPEIPLTSFSILFARYKNVLQPAAEAVRSLETLPEQNRILIAEGCTHHRQCNDIGTVKLPRWIQQRTGKTFQYDFVSGNTFPEDLSAYRLVIHCGGCMLNQREMESRAQRAAAQKVPYTNYGILIAYLHGILERSLTLLREMKD